MRRILTGVLALMILGVAVAEATELKSAPMEYRGYSEKAYKGYELTSTYVEMSDGVRLAVDIYLPAGAAEGQKFPAIFELTPYSRAYVNPSFKALERTQSKNIMGGYGAHIPNPFCFNKLFLEHGYALIIADVRGSGASFGHRFDLMSRIGEDGAELVEWIASQEWCDGSVGMKGGSYMAISQILTASRQPEALKAIYLMVYPFGYQDLYVGGIYNQGFLVAYSELMWDMNMNRSKASGAFPLLPSAPAVDEDGDGEFLDEIPMDKNGDGDFLNDYNFPDDPNDPPQYSDGSAREHIYYLATREHLKNAYLHDWISKAIFIDTDTRTLGLAEEYGDFNGYDISPIGLMPKIMESGIPIYHVAGWMDAEPRSAFIFYSTAKATNPSKLLAIPSYHILYSPFYKYFGENQAAVLKGLGVESLRFFDRYLKGIENGIDAEPPIMLFVMGKGWRMENEWPLARQVETDYFLAQGNALDTIQSQPGADEYKADFTHDSGFGDNRGNRWKMFAIPAEVPDRTEHDKQCLTYTTDPLEADIEVTGHPVVDLWVSSTAGDGDIFVYLSDVTPDGKVVLVTEHPFRAGFAGLRDNDKMVLGGRTGVDVKPDLPWHGYEKADYDGGVFADGEVVELKFDLQPTSWVFKKGHRIRVSIAAADWPTFRLNQALSPDNDPASPNNIVPVITLHRDEEHLSRIILPVIPD